MIASGGTGRDFAKLSNIDARVQQEMLPIAEDPGFAYGDIFPVKRYQDPKMQEDDILGGYRLAIPTMGRDVIKALLKLKYQSDKGYYDPTNVVEALL